MTLERGVFILLMSYVMTGFNLFCILWIYVMAEIWIRSEGTFLEKLRQEKKVIDYLKSIWPNCFGCLLAMHLIGWPSRAIEWVWSQILTETTKAVFPEQI